MPGDACCRHCGGALRGPDPHGILRTLSGIGAVATKIIAAPIAVAKGMLKTSFRQERRNGQ